MDTLRTREDAANNPERLSRKRKAEEAGYEIEEEQDGQGGVGEEEEEAQDGQSDKSSEYPTDNISTEISTDSDNE